MTARGVLTEEGLSKIDAFYKNHGELSIKLTNSREQLYALLNEGDKRKLPNEGLLPGNVRTNRAFVRSMASR